MSTMLFDNRPMVLVLSNSVSVAVSEEMVEVGMKVAHEEEVEPEEPLIYNDASGTPPMLQRSITALDRLIHWDGFSGRVLQLVIPRMSLLLLLYCCNRQCSSN